MRKIYLTLTIAFLSCVLNLSAQLLPERPTPIKHVNDFSAAMSKIKVDSLELALKNIYDTKKIDFVIIFSDSLCGYTKKVYGKRIQTKWKINLKKNKNTIFFFIKPTGGIGERYLMVLTSKDLKAKVTEPILNDIADKDMIPYFKTNDFYTGLYKSINSIVEVATK